MTLKMYNLNVDDYGFVAIIADNTKEARAYAWNTDWASNDYFDGYVEMCRALKLNRKFSNKEAMEAVGKGEVEWMQGLKHGIYCYVESDCEDCGRESNLSWEFDKALCDDCIEKISEERKQ